MSNPSLKDAVEAIHVTIFRDPTARSLEVKNLTLEELRNMVVTTTATSKSDLPWLKLAVFGDKKSDKGCLRNNDNVLEITGIEVDYDAKVMAFEDAVEAVKRAKLTALIYTSPSHAANAPKWRVVLPASRRLLPSSRSKLVARINGVLGGVVAGESFTLSQSYYFGSVNANPDHRAEVVDGDFIDQRDDLDPGALGKGGNDRVPDAKFIEDIRSGAIYHTSLLTLAARRAADGWGAERIIEMLEDLMEKSKGERDKRWHGSYDDIPKLVLSAVEKYAAAAAARRDRGEFFTDLGNARRLVRTHGNDIRYVPAWRCWLTWQDGHWRRDKDGAIVRMAKACIEEMFSEAGLINEEGKRKAMRVHALKSQSAQRLNAMVKLAESEIEVILPADKIDADPYLLGVRNGIIDLRTCEFRNARREDCVTKLAGIAFDPDAKCPNWDAFLKKILDEPLIAYLKRASGYILTGLTGEEVMFILWGGGNNGKSTWREAIFAMMGDYAMAAEASLLVTNNKTGGATPDLARLHGCRFVTINETEQNDQLNEARVKFITSHDKIAARNLYEAPFDFTPTHKTALTTNNKPIVKSTNVGTWRRINLVPFVMTIAAEDRNQNFREEKLLPELDGILNWALAGLREYWRKGLEPPTVVTDATNEYKSDMDLIGSWIEERCLVDPVAEETTAALHVDYVEWARHAGASHAMSSIALGRELVDRGFARKKVNRGRGVGGLKLDPARPPLLRAF
jgi:P4 family phage/plasmid primase-like protien